MSIEIGDFVEFTTESKLDQGYVHDIEMKKERTVYTILSSVSHYDLVPENKIKLLIKINKDKT